MQAVRSVRSGHRAVRPRTTRVENRGPLAQGRGQRRCYPSRPKEAPRIAGRREGPCQEHPRKARRPLRRPPTRRKGPSTAFAQCRNARRRRIRTHPDAVQIHPERGTDVCRYRTPLPHPNALAAPPRLPPPPFMQSPCAARGTPPRRPPATRPGWRPSPWRW